MLAAVYTDWWLPQTASERATTPDLRWDGARLISPERWSREDFIFELGFVNHGRGEIGRAAVVNVIVPDFVIGLSRCDSSGNKLPEGGLSRTSESLVADESGTPIPSTYWNGRVDFPGRIARPLFFRAAVHGSWIDLPMRVSVTAVELDEGFSRSTTLDLAPLA